MVIEFIGTTGAGKTTLIRRVLSRLGETTPVTDATSLVTGLVGLRGLRNVTVQNVVQEVVGFPFLVSALRKYGNFIGYAMELFARKGHKGLEKINNFRSLERKLAVNEIIRLVGRERYVLVDEGPILVAHMFTFMEPALTDAEIEKFAALVPLPDLVIYVRAPADVIVERTMRRPDRPIQLKSTDFATTEEHIKRAVSVFDRLVGKQNIRSRLLTVEDYDLTEPAYEAMVNDTVKSILRRGISVEGDNRNARAIA